MNNQKIKMYNPEIHHRHSIRLKEYDYSSEGLYFITVCAQDKKCMFGKIINGDMYLNEAGRLVEKWYLKLQEKYPDIICMEHIIMPNHFHCIIRIVGAGFARPNASTGTSAHIDNDEMPYAENRAGKPRPYEPTIGQIIGFFKYQTTKEIDLPIRLWQRNYYEHIIRNQHSYEEISDYIITNPLRWEKDLLFIEQ